MEWLLDEYIGEPEKLLQAIQNTVQLKGSTDTYTAFNLTVQRYLNDEDPGRRPNVPLTLILITDGRAKVYMI